MFDALDGLPWYLKAVLLVFLLPATFLWFLALIRGMK